MVEQFAEYFAQVIAGGVQVEWMLRGRLNRSEWSTTTLGEAFCNYRWRKANFAETAAKLSILRVDLVQALAKQDGAALRRAVKAILKWGGVLPGGNSKWLCNLDDATLLARLGGACRMLQTEPFDSAAFEAEGFRSNAGFTKVYALALPNFAIFDSRVSAALQMLICMFARERDLQEMPEALRIHAMPAKGPAHARRAAFNGAPFPSTYSSNTAAHICSNRRTNEIFSRAISKASGLPGAQWCVDHDDRLRRLEAALFMVGYRLPPEFAYA